jgi:hypothetical protein
MREQAVFVVRRSGDRRRACPNGVDGRDRRVGRREIRCSVGTLKVT